MYIKTTNNNCMEMLHPSHHLSSSAVHCPLTKLEEELLFNLPPLGSFPSPLETTSQLKSSTSPPFLSWVQFIDSLSTRKPSTKLISCRHGEENPHAWPWVAPQGPSPNPNGETNLSLLSHHVWIWVCNKLLELVCTLSKGSKGGAGRRRYGFFSQKPSP